MKKIVVDTNVPASLQLDRVDLDIHTPLLKISIQKSQMEMLLGLVTPYQADPQEEKINAHRDFGMMDDLIPGFLHTF